MNRLHAAAAAIMLVSVPAFAAGNMKLGPVEVHPFAELEGRSDDNIYLSTGGETSAFITQPSVGAKFALKMQERHQAELGYRADFLGYSEEPSINNALHQTVDLSLRSAAASGWTFTLSDKFQDTTDPAASELIDRARRAQNDASVGAAYRAESGFGYGFDASHTLHDYSKAALETLLNRSELGAGAGVSFPFGGKTRLTLDYRYSKVTYAESAASTKDSMGHGLSAGIQGELAAKVKGQVGVGFKQRTYDEDVAGLDDSTSLVSYDAAVEWSPTERTAVALSGTRGFQESTFSTNRYYEMTAADLKVSQKLGNKFTGIVSGGFEVDTYPEDTTIGAKTAKRQDDLVNAGLELTYDIQDYLKAGVFFRNRSRSSNFSDNFDYANNVIGANVKLTF